MKYNLALVTHGVVGNWTIRRTTGHDYFDQLTAEVREEREDSRGRIKIVWVQERRDNNYLDCDLMMHAAPNIGISRNSLLTLREDSDALERVTGVQMTTKHELSDGSQLIQFEFDWDEGQSRGQPTEGQVHLVQVGDRWRIASFRLKPRGITLRSP